MAPVDPNQAQIVAASPEPVTVWEGEPSSMDDLLSTYIVESKMSSSMAGASLYLTVSSTRDGNSFNVVEGQTHKLFLVAWVNFEQLSSSSHKESVKVQSVQVTF